MGIKNCLIYLCAFPPNRNADHETGRYIANLFKEKISGI